MLVDGAPYRNQHHSFLGFNHDQIVTRAQGKREYYRVGQNLQEILPMLPGTSETVPDSAVLL